MQDTQKLPLYYEQVDSLMKVMSKAYLNGKGIIYFNALKQLYSRVRPDIEEKKQNYFDCEIKNLMRQLQEVDGGFSDQTNIILIKNYELETELFEELHKIGIFKILKETTDVMP